jgi:hypothetical protein
MVVCKVGSRRPSYLEEIEMRVGAKR